MSEQKETPPLTTEQKGIVTNVAAQLEKGDSKHPHTLTFTQEEADKLTKKGIDSELRKQFRKHFKGSYPETDQK